MGTATFLVFCGALYVACRLCGANTRAERAAREHDESVYQQEVTRGGEV